eukprot:TRINITY_DN11484_c0_g1_i1.p1 TRINITY_DN11484_c0_g1~~TRINITY_DN11484_c0_g1_i1.p1  ORF type:complete len:329 (-),score=47.75 TRINITY_DN11484_c0_g1_i1:48-1034(-)
MKRLHGELQELLDDSAARPSKIHKTLIPRYPLQILVQPKLEVLDPLEFLVRPRCNGLELDCPLELDLSHFVEHNPLEIKHELAQLCTSVSSLNLSFWNYLTDDHLTLLLGHKSVLPNIERLNISHTQVSDSGIKIIANKCPNLTSINLTGCHEVTDVSLSLLAQNCKKIQHMRLSGCSLVGDAGVQLIAQETKDHLRTLDVKDCPLVTDKTLMFLGFYCPNISSLQLKNTNVTIGVLSKLLATRLHLTELNAQGLLITDSFLLLLLRSQQTLKILDISFCFHVSFSGIRRIIKELDLLEELHLFGLLKCHESTDWEEYSSQHGLSLFF